MQLSSRLVVSFWVSIRVLHYVLSIVFVALLLRRVILEHCPYFIFNQHKYLSTKSTLVLLCHLILGRYSPKRLFSTIYVLELNK
jgi:hypothetical protein